LTASLTKQSKLCGASSADDQRLDGSNLVREPAMTGSAR
jgi:hypothetical protein